MTDQEFQKELGELMSENTSDKKKQKKKNRTPWSRKKKLLVGVVGGVIVLAVAGKLLSGGKTQTLPVTTQTLAKGDVTEVLSISGPLSGTDSAEVVSNLHAEIRELMVKEGDSVTAGQVLASLDQTDVLKELDIAQNEYNLAVANLDEAQRTAESGYSKALQDLKTAELDLQRKSMLFDGGDVTQVDLEAAQNAFNDAKRQVSTFTLEGGKPVANRSYSLQVKNAEFALEQKKKRLEETEVTSPITGTVVRVNTRVGRFADTVDNDKPLFVIDNLDQLEMKISVSEYSIGKVHVGQTAEISADILGDQKEEGIITSISPTGEEKGNGSTERVIPTMIKIQNKDTKLIAGITARAKIVLNEATDVWVVPVAAVIANEEGDFLASVDNGTIHLVPVETGVESDVDVEVKGDELSEGMQYVPAPGAELTEGAAVTAIPQM